MKTFQVLGDTHLGRTFRTGVPLHRIGEREGAVWTDFIQQINNPTAEVHIHMGDLFDKFVVPPEVVLLAADCYSEAAKANPKVMYLILMGNHDPSKDATKRSSFDIFQALMESVPNVLVVRDPLLYDGLGLLPYSVFGTAEESLENLLLQGTPEVVFGHWDVTDFGGSNVIPTLSLAQAGITTAFTGHDHVPRIETRHGVTINVVGSMQPYSHAEDKTGKWYQTLTLAQLEGLNTTDLNIRILLGADEVLPAGLECLSLTAKRADLEAVEAIDTAEFEGIDLATELSNLLPDSIRTEVMEVFAK